MKNTNTPTRLRREKTERKNLKTDKKKAEEGKKIKIGRESSAKDVNKGELMKQRNKEWPESEFSEFIDVSE